MLLVDLVAVALHGRLCHGHDDRADEAGHAAKVDVERGKGHAHQAIGGDDDARRGILELADERRRSLAQAVSLEGAREHKRHDEDAHAAV